MSVAKQLLLTIDFNNSKQETLILEMFFHPKMMTTNLNNNHQSTVKSDFQMIVSTEAALWMWTMLSYPQHTTRCVLNERQHNVSLFSGYRIRYQRQSWPITSRQVRAVYAAPTVNPTGSEMSPQNFINEQRGDDVVPCERALQRAQHSPSVLTTPRTLSRHTLHHTDGFPPAGGKKTSFTQV